MLIQLFQGIKNSSVSFIKSEICSVLSPWLPKTKKKYFFKAVKAAIYSHFGQQIEMYWSQLNEIM